MLFKKVITVALLASALAYDETSTLPKEDEIEETNYWKNRQLPYYRRKRYYRKKKRPWVPKRVPTLPPTGECLVEIDITCTLRDGKTDCKEIEACRDLSVCKHSCMKPMCFSVEICNRGTEIMEVTELTRSFNNVQSNMLGRLGVNPLPAGRCTSVKLCEEVNVCGKVDVSMDVSVKADPPRGISCFAEDYYKFVKMLPPTPEPTPAPTRRPFPDPTPEPTRRPTPAPTPSPTPSPTSPPTPSPTSSPTPEPTQGCELGIDIECKLDSGEECSVGRPNVVPCEGRPLEMQMLYNGGDCSQAFNRQDDGKYSCQDIGQGPPTEQGAESYLVVTAQKDSGTVYFNGPVAVGETFNLIDQRSPGTRFEADQTVQVYSSANGNQGELLQVVDYHSSCSQNLDLKDRFGAVQIVGWYNEEQGWITCFSNISYDLIINIPLSIAGNDLTLETLVIRTNYDGSKNLTDQVAGLVVPAGGALNVQLNTPIDLAKKYRYTFLTSMSGRTNAGIRCEGVDFSEILIGAGNEYEFPT